MTDEELSKMISEFLPYPAEGQHHALKQFAKLVASAEREACAKVCHDKAWELKERSIKETVKTQRARLASEAAGWHDAFTAIRERGAP